MVDASTRRRIGLLGIALLVSAAAVGCTWLDDEPVSEAAATAASSSSTATDDAAATGDSDLVDRERTPMLSDLAPGSVIATGAFSGEATGRIEIRANGSDRGFDVALAAVDPAPPPGASLELNALPSKASESDLRSGYSYYRYDPLEQARDQTFATPAPGYGGFETNDPSYMRTAIIWAAQPGASIGFGSIVATADLTWHLPDMNPGLDIVDHGSTDGARGAVTRADDGAPWSYLVAAGDTANGITTRFGITERDLEWLNPDRDRGRLILADVTLNLSRDTRGLRG